ncbi:MAG: DUF2461 domain-containing protein [Cyclobacteriaceae bacterium]
MIISSENIGFLKDLSENNHKPWFEAHKSDFLPYKEEFTQFHASVKSLIEQHDQISGGRVFRIYRDVRFSKDKTPYKNNWSGGFKRATAQLRGGYYYQLSPGNSFVAGGFFGPNSQDLLHIRRQISQDSEPLLDVLKSKTFKAHFGELKGEKVKTAPRGFSVDDPNIELIRHKQFIVYRHFTDEEVLKPDFASKINESFKAMRPYFDVMSMYLTTDLNGEDLT